MIIGQELDMIKTEIKFLMKIVDENGRSGSIIKDDN
jgi:hypothetical protein